MFNNLLNTALRVIPKQSIDYYRFLSRTTNEVGRDVSIYADPLKVIGSLQAVSWDRLQFLGLDSEKEYVAFYTASDLLNIERDTSGDQLAYQGKRYQIIGKPNDWVRQDGWNGVLCVRIYDRE